jgi:hypothetical protein
LERWEGMGVVESSRRTSEASDECGMDVWSSNFELSGTTVLLIQLF